MRMCPYRACRVGFLVLAACCIVNCGRRVAPVIAVTVTDRTAQRLSDWATVRSGIQLSIPPEVAIGRSKSVKVDHGSGDVIVVDVDASRSAYRFAADGRFQRAYPATPTPRHVQSELIDVAVTLGSRLVMAGNLRLRRYSVAGSLEREVELSTSVADILGYDSTVYMLTTAAFRRPGQIVSYSADLVEQARFGQADERLRKWNFFPSGPYLAMLGSHLFSQRLYEPVLVEYDEVGREVRRFQMPPRSGEATPALWSGASDSLSHEAKRTILRQMHVIKCLYAVGDRLFFLESHEATGLGALVFLSPKTGTAVRIPGSALFQYKATLEPSRCSFPELVGGDSRSVAVLIDDPQLFTACADEFHAFRSFDPDVVEKPIVVFLEPRV